MMRDLIDVLKDAQDSLTVPDVWRRLGLPGEPRVGVQKSPLREDRHGKAFSIYQGGRRWKDHGDGTGGDAVAFVEMATGCDRARAMRTVIEMAGMAHQLRDPREAGARPLPVRVPDLRPAQTERGGWGARPLPVLPEVVEATPERLARLARLRGLAVESLSAMVEAGLLAFTGEWRGKLAEYRHYVRQWDGEGWMVLDATRCNAQLRRLDGEPLWGDVKGLTLPDSWASWPLGTGGRGERVQSAGFRGFLLVEGAPDFLAAGQVLREAGWWESWQPAGMLGAGQNLTGGARAGFLGAEVIIVSQRDEAKHRKDGSVYFPGQEAAERWAGQLREVARSVRVLDLPEAMPGKDLNDWLKWTGRGTAAALLGGVRGVADGGKGETTDSTNGTDSTNNNNN